MKTAQQMQKAAIENNINDWKIYNCSICDYLCGFIFDINKEFVIYDNGCNCTGRYFERSSQWDEVADFYNIQSNTKVIAKMNEYWGFKENM